MMKTGKTRGHHRRESKRTVHLHECGTAERKRDSMGTNTMAIRQGGEMVNGKMEHNLTLHEHTHRREVCLRWSVGYRRQEVPNFQGVQVRLTCFGQTVNTLMRVLIKVDGFPMIALVDTDAIQSNIDSSSLQKAGISYQKTSHLRIYGIAESEGIAAAIHVVLSTSIGGVEMEPLQFTVLPSNMLPVSVILGADYLKSQGMIIDTCKRCISWSSDGCDIDLYIQNNGRVDKRIVRKLQFYAAQLFS